MLLLFFLAQNSLPERWDADRNDPVVDAIQVWRLGEKYLPADDSDPWVEPPSFDRVDGATRGFLEHPSLNSAVQFSCAVHRKPYESALEAALKEARPELRLQALVVLLRVKAPRSVDLQWKALRELDLNDERAQALIAELKKEFDSEKLQAGLKKNPPADRYEDDLKLEWTIRAAGVSTADATLERLKELSRSDNLGVSLAAQASLQDFPGKAGDEALIYCLLGWKYDAYVRAANALLKRNPALLNEALTSHVAPDDCRYHQGLFLARCNNSDAVPILCDKVGMISMIDGEMFDHIGRLAKEDHWPLVKSLASQVRPDQRDKAEQIVKTVRERLKK
jgi:hypothetical protein